MGTRTVDSADGPETTAAAWRDPRVIGAELRRRDGILFAVAGLHAALFAAFVAGIALDPRTVGGDPVWLKPAKFAGSIALVSATLAWLGVHLPVGERARRRVSLIVGSGFLIEIALIGGQAGRGVGSHFNQSTTADAAVGAAMAVTIVVVTCAIAWLAVRSRRGAFAVHPAFASGILLGLGLFVVGAFEGGAMVALQSNGVDPVGPTVPVLGWHLVGDFRLAHFVGLHALQVVPGAGYVLATSGDRLGIDRPVHFVRAIALGHALVLCLAVVLAVLPLVG